MTLTAGPALKEHIDRLVVPHGQLALWSLGQAGFVLDVLGLSMNHIFELLKQRFSDDQVNRAKKIYGYAKKAWNWITSLIDTSKSPAENTKQLVERAKDFATEVLTGIAEWIAGKVGEELAILATAAAASGGLSEVLDESGRRIGLGYLEMTGRAERLRLWTEATGARPFALEVATLDAGRRMVWEGGLPLGLFRGVRTFTLTPREGGVEFEMTETFSGPLSGLIGKSIPDLTPSFEKFATGLLALASKE